MTLVGRVQAILWRPKETWRLIAEEPATTRSIFLGYVAPLAALPAIADAIKLSMLGFDGGAAVLVGIVSGSVFCVAGLAALFFLTFLFYALVNTAGVRLSVIAVFKLVGYASTPTLLAMVLWIASSFWPLALLGGGYSMYLFLIGLRPVTACSHSDGAICAAVLATCLLLAVGAFKADLPYCAGSRAWLSCPAA